MGFRTVRVRIYTEGCMEMIACGQCFVALYQAVAVIAVLFYPLKYILKGVYNKAEGRKKC